jgi:hypothetical protein
LRAEVSGRETLDDELPGCRTSVLEAERLEYEISNGAVDGVPVTASMTRPAMLNPALL